jgi:hypothetical protein
MADHDVDVCNDWNGQQGDKVTFINNTGMACTISADKDTTWPFKNASPLPTIPPGGTTTTHLKTPLGNGKYPYSVSCCKDKVPKVVTVP